MPSVEPSFTLELPIVAPIPVGHRVEVRVYLSEGLFSKRLTPDEYWPLVIDHDTGVVYGFHTHLGESGASLPERPEHSRRHGKVIACLVRYLATDCAGKTTLVIQPGEPPPYR
jgi:hypothetical protein